MKTFLITISVVVVLSFLLALTLLNGVQDFSNGLRTVQSLAPDASLATDYVMAAKISLCILLMALSGWFFSWTQSLNR